MFEFCLFQEAENERIGGGEERGSGGKEKVFKRPGNKLMGTRYDHLRLYRGYICVRTLK